MLKSPGYIFNLLIQIILLLILNACSQPKIQVQPGNAMLEDRLDRDSVVMADGYVLPMKTWIPEEEPSIAVLAIHGFNDYSNAFDAVGRAFAEDKVITYAIDQRGFGATEQRGVWAGQDRMQSDLIATINLLCDKHGDLPLYVLGESMGGAVIISSLKKISRTCISGLILSAPAVWGWQTMPWWQTLPLKVLAHTVPEMTVTGENLDIQPSDNDEMLRALGRDPLIIKETRIDAIYGLTDLMEAALNNGSAFNMPSLILYGEHDEIIPAESFCTLLNSLPGRSVSQWRLVLYPDGYHMLSRDLQGDIVISDMRAWLQNQSASLPSGHEMLRDISRLSALDGCDQLQEFHQALIN